MKETEKELLNILKNAPNQEFEILDQVGTGRLIFLRIKI